MRYSLRVAKTWVRGLLGLASVFLGIRYRIEGRQHLPTQGPYLIACKHQSPWETLVFHTLIDNPAFFLKDTLLSVPLLGWYLRKLQMIPVARHKKSPQARERLQNAIESALHCQRPLVIFPEGTRTLPGQTLPYRSGVYNFYQQYHLPVIPAALNSGYFWRKHCFLKIPGTITLQFADPIPPGLPRATFMTQLTHTIETASTALLHGLTK